MKATDLARVRATLWTAADKRRANSPLSVGQFRAAILGLVFLAYAENRFDEVSPEIEAKASARNPSTPADDVVARIHADPEFAAHVAQQLGAVDG